MDFEIKKSVCYVGLVDVCGGKMWYCVTAKKDLEKYAGSQSLYFCTKKECENYIRKNHTGEMKKYLLGKLKERKGRACWY